WISPNMSEFCAHLCATTCATPPAPIMRTFFFIFCRCFLFQRFPAIYYTSRLPSGRNRFSFASRINTATQGSGERTLEIRVIEFADDFDRAVEFAHGNGWHFHAIKPVLLDHGITGRILK